MDPSRPQPSFSVSNLVPVWEEQLVDDGGGSFEPAEAATVVEQVVHHEPRPTRLVSPPERFDPSEPVTSGSAYAVDAFDDTSSRRERRVERADRVRSVEPLPAPTHELPVRLHDIPAVDYDQLRRRDIARELLRDRLVSMAEQREHRSAYEIAFILLAASVAVLLAAPPLVQVLLAARGIQV